MKVMRIALFAAHAVGREVAQFFGESGEVPACLVLDSKNSGGFNQEIIAACRALEQGVPVFESASLYEETMLAALEALEVDLIILAWWPYIIKDRLIRLPRTGCLNFHPSYLPYNRGKHYNFWALVEEAPFGVTLHWVDEGIDSGDIAFQKRIETTWEDTGATLYEKAQREIVALFKEKFAEIKSGRIPRLAQDTTRGSFHLSKELEAASRIELEQTYTARQLLNLLRARTFPPHPAAWFIEGDARYEVRVEIRKVDDGKA